MLPKFFQYQNSLTRTTIIKMGIRIAIIIIAVTLVSYWHVMSNLELQVVEQLDKYITERGQRESSLFVLSEDNHVIYQEEFLSQLKQMGNEVPRERFHKIFQAQEDGTVRMHPQFFHGFKQPNSGVLIQGLTGFIGQNMLITDEIIQRIIITFDMLTRFSPAWAAWQDRFPNLYVSMPENILLEYWIGTPWGLDAPADINLGKEVWVAVADKKHNPTRETVWTGVYYDTVAKDWMVSCATPVDVNDQHLITIGHDILLNKLFERTINDHLDGAYNLIFREDGLLITHPHYMTQIMEKQGQFDILKSDDQHLLNIFQSVKNRQANAIVIENPQNNEYLAITKIDGPDWYFVTVYPKSLLANLAFETARFILLLGIISLLIEVIVLLLVLRRQVALPLQDFLDATQQIAAGNFNVEAMQNLPLSRHDEIGELAQSFNSMGKQLKTSFDTLDAKVIERTAQLNDKIEELTKTRQELIQREKMAALGQLVAGIAHEVNTPLGAIRSSAETLSNNLKQTLTQFPTLFEILTSAQQEKFIALIEQSLQGKVILTFREKRVAKKAIAAELEQLGIKNRSLPDTFVSLNIFKNVGQYFLLLESTHRDLIFKMAYQLSTLSRSAENITNAVFRASKVIFALKTFARYDQSGEKKITNLQEGLETVLTLYYNQIKHNIELIKVYDEVPPISCYSDELNQVWTNILHNALQAMDYKGTLTVAISQRNNYAVVSITDNGKGMSPEIKEKIFTPFFTTKPAGEGSGLGLDIVKKIVDKHEGKIEVDSEEGKGTTFSVWLPIGPLPNPLPKGEGT
jgi:two-component system, NtrC family, sensor kinase